MTCRAGWNIKFYYVFCFSSGVFIAAPSVNRDNFVSIDACFTDWAGSAVVLDLEPAIETGPAVEVATQGDDRLTGQLQGETGNRSLVRLQRSGEYSSLTNGCNVLHDG